MIHTLIQGILNYEFDNNFSKVLKIYCKMYSDFKSKMLNLVKEDKEVLKSIHLGNVS